MKDRTSWMTVASLSALIAAVGINGPEFIEAIDAAWKFIRIMSKDMSLGSATAFAALTICTLSQAALRRWIPHSSNDKKHVRTFMIEFSAIVIGVLVMMLSMHQVNMSTIMFGVGVGLAAPFVYRAFAAAWWATKGDYSDEQ